MKILKRFIGALAIAVIAVSAGNVIWKIGLSGYEHFGLHTLWVTPINITLTIGSWILLVYLALWINE